MFDTFFLFALCAAIACMASSPLPAAAQAAGETPSLLQRAKCGAFYDKWDVLSAPGMPTNILAMTGMLHETLAARDCIEQKNAALACEHYRRVLVGFEKLDPLTRPSTRR